MSFRQTLSGFRKKAKQKLSKIGSKKDEQPAGDGSSGGFDRSSSSLQPDKPDWGRTTSSAAKLFLHMVERASDAFPPLKSVAGGLCAILENCEVHPAIVRLVRNTHSFPSERRSTNRR